MSEFDNSFCLIIVLGLKKETTEPFFSQLYLESSTWNLIQSAMFLKPLKIRRRFFCFLNEDLRWNLLTKWVVARDVVNNIINIIHCIDKTNSNNNNFHWNLCEKQQQQIESWCVFGNLEWLLFNIKSWSRYQLYKLPK